MFHCVANIKGIKSHKIIEDGIKILENLEHRGATGADPLVGDGAGMLLQIPHDFFVKKTKDLKFMIPEEGQYGVGVFFMPQDSNLVKKIIQIVENICSEEKLNILGWRNIPTDNACLSLDEDIVMAEPVHYQLFINKNDNLSQDEFERKLFILRKCISNAVINQIGDVEDFYPVSLSSRTIVYKGMFLADQLAKYYPDLSDPNFKSALALVHQSFSTNNDP